MSKQWIPIAVLGALVIGGAYFLGRKNDGIEQGAVGMTTSANPNAPPNYFVSTGDKGVDRSFLRQTGRTDRVYIKQEGKTDRTDIRQDEKTERTGIRWGGLTGISQAIGGTISNVGTSYLSNQADKVSARNETAQTLITSLRDVANTKMETRVQRSENVLQTAKTIVGAGRSFLRTISNANVPSVTDKIKNIFTRA